MKIKTHIGHWFLNRIKTDSRIRKGCNLRNARSVGLLHLERDHEFYQVIRDLSKRLKDDLGVKNVSILSYVDSDSKQTPSWLVKKLYSGYFCKSDLNWYGKPVKEVQGFIENDFDILIDLEIQPILALKYILRSSNACMKVGPEQEGYSKDYDIKICQAILNDEETNSKDIWQEQTERTLQFITEANIL